MEIPRHVRQGVATLMVGGLTVMGALRSQANMHHVEDINEIAVSAVSADVMQNSVDMLGTGTHWQLAGVTQQANHQLAVRAMNEAVVHQDGTPGYINAPVNLYGTRLQTTGAFAITAGLSNIKGVGELSLYGKPPLVEDEFRAEKATLDMKINGTTFTASLSEQPYGKNVRNTSKTIKAGSVHVVSAKDYNGTLSFTVDGQSAGSMPDLGVFSSKNVYVGADALTSGGSFTVNSLKATGINGAKVGLVDTRQETIPVNPNGFAALAQKIRPGFIVGAAVAPGPMMGDTTYRQILSNYNAISVENVGKFQTIHPLSGNTLSSYDFADMDALVAMANKAGLKIHGHAIVFGEANPAWLQAIAKNHSEQMEGILTSHINTVVSRYKGKVSGWDINEVLADYDTTPGQYGLRKNIWYQTIGPSYVEKAIKAVLAADPSAEIWLNDFGLESDDDRFAVMINLVKRLQAEGIPISGVGFQSHIDEGDTNSSDTHIDTAKLAGRFQALANLGLKARVSELDISNTPQEYPVFGDVVRTCLKAPNCVGVTTWGAIDRYSSSGSVDSKGVIQYGTGLPWDINEKALPPVQYIRQAITSP